MVCQFGGNNIIHMTRNVAVFIESLSRIIGLAFLSREQLQSHLMAQSWVLFPQAHENIY